MFWPDIPLGLRHMFRALKPGGMAYFGGGTGINTPAEIRESVVRKQKARSDGMGRSASCIPKVDHSMILHEMQQIGGKSSISSGKTGFWLKWHCEGKNAA